MRVLFVALAVVLVILILPGDLAAGQQLRSDADATVAAEVLALEQKIEAAVVRGDVAFVDSVPSADFHFVHGDGWTRGGKPLMEYLVHDLDSVKAEVHGDIVITYGRYVSLYSPAGVDPTAARQQP